MLRLMGLEEMKISILTYLEKYPVRILKRLGSSMKSWKSAFTRVRFCLEIVSSDTLVAVMFSAEDAGEGGFVVVVDPVFRLVWEKNAADDIVVGT